MKYGVKNVVSLIGSPQTHSQLPQDNNDQTMLPNNQSSQEQPFPSSKLPSLVQLAQAQPETTSTSQTPAPTSTMAGTKIYTDTYKGKINESDEDDLPKKLNHEFKFEELSLGLRKK